MGCMVTPAAVVEQSLRIRGSRTFDWMHMQTETIPWRCLVKCPSNNHHHTRVFKSLSRWEGPQTYYHETLPDELRSASR